MFVYSLSGLEIDEAAAQDVEIEENGTTARSGVYQILSQLFTIPDSDAHAAAVAGEWPVRLRAAAELLPFDFDFGSASVPESMSAEDFQAEFLRLFEVGGGPGGPPAPLVGGGYQNGGRMTRMEEVTRFYEYFGLKISIQDPRPPDHVATELEFMQYLAFKEAASPSARLQGSFRRAQMDFLERQLLPWLPELAARSARDGTLPFLTWTTQTTARFAEADSENLRR